MEEVVATQPRITRKGNAITFDINAHAVARLTELKLATGEAFPKIGVLVVAYEASDLLRQTVERIPQSLRDVILEIFIFDDASPDDTFGVAKKLQKSSFWGAKLQAFRNLRNLGYGGNQKVGYRYAIEKGFDYVILLHGDGQYAPESLPELILGAVEKQRPVIFASRMLHRKAALDGGMPLYKWLGNQVLTLFENFMLGLKLTEYHTGYRCYSTEVLKRIPFAMNTDDFHFDSQIIVQLRALNAPFFEVPIKTFYGNEVCHVNGMQYAFQVAKSVLEYRLHQLHIIRRPEYLIDVEFRYTKKFSSFSSHGQILSLVDKPGRALDLGSSTGLLTDRLLDKGVRSVGVDQVPSERVIAPFEYYVRANLEDARSLSFGREFDYVILADVIEHLRNSRELLRHSRNFLRPEGRIIVSTPNIAIWFYRLSLLVGRFNYGPRGVLDETHVRFYTLDSLRKVLREAGYVITRESATGLPFEIVFESIGKSRVLKLVDSAYALLARLWPRLFAYQFVVEAHAAGFEQD